MSNETMRTPAASEDVRERLKTLIREGVEYRAKEDGAYLYGPSVDATADRIVDALSSLTARGEAGGDSTDCPTCGDELAVYWEEGRIRGVVSLDEPARIALLRTPAAPAPDWSEVRERANMLRAVLREHGFEHLRSALVGQHSDAVFYGQWERHKALLRDLLDALDAALSSEAQGEEDAVRRTWELAVQRAYGCLDYCGGYRGAELRAFHSGIKTVIRALEAGPDTVDTQTAALDRIGAAFRIDHAEAVETQTDNVAIVEE